MCENDNNNEVSHADEGVSLGRWDEIEPLHRDRTCPGAGSGDGVLPGLLRPRHSLIDSGKLVVLGDGSVHLQRLHPSVVGFKIPTNRNKRHSRKNRGKSLGTPLAEFECARQGCRGTNKKINKA